jgi:hypothetical protein
MIRQDLPSAAQAAGQAITANMTASLAEATAAASAVAASISVGGSGATGSVLQALKKSGNGLATWWERTEREWAASRLAEMSTKWGGMPIPADVAAKYVQLQLQGEVGQTELENAIARMGREYVNQQYINSQYSNAGIIPDSYDVGGVVAGPAGAPRAAMVHGGEMVLTREDQQALLSALRSSAGAWSGDRVIAINVNVDGRNLMGTLRAPLADLLRAGRIDVGIR